MSLLQVLGLIIAIGSLGQASDGHRSLPEQAFGTGTANANLGVEQDQSGRTEFDAQLHGRQFLGHPQGGVATFLLFSTLQREEHITR